MARNESRTSTATDHDRLQFLRVADVCALLCISRPTLWRLRRASEFPAPTYLSRRSIGWRRSDVEAWTRTRPEAVLVEPASTPLSVPDARDRPAAAPRRLASRRRSQLALGLPPSR